MEACDAFICKLGTYEHDIDVMCDATGYGDADQTRLREVEVLEERVPAQPHVLRPMRWRCLQLATPELVFRCQP